MKRLHHHDHEHAHDRHSPEETLALLDLSIRC